MAKLGANPFAIGWLEGEVPYCLPVDKSLAEKLAQQLILQGAMKCFSLADMMFEDKADVVRHVEQAMVVDPNQCGTTLPDATRPFIPV